MPSMTGSASNKATIGRVCVACCAASRSHREPPIAITSTPRLINSAKMPGARCLAFRRPPLDGGRAPINPAEIAQAVHESPRERRDRIGSSHLNGGDNSMYEGDDWLPACLLRAGRDWPCRHAAK
jgi:hypothetical protein